MEVDLGFIILCPDRKIGGVRNTCGSIRHHSYNREPICVLPSDTKNEELEEDKQWCPDYRSKDTITSLVNAGFRHLKHEWGFIVFAGSRIPQDLERKIATFVKEDHDVLYPLVEQKYDFVSGSFNGVLINRKFFKTVGKFPDSKMEKEGLNDFEFAKLLWAVDAMEHGAMFKGILGMRVI
jgi:hypothetical protein